MRLEPGERRRIYEYMRKNGYSRLTIKILMSYDPDGMDRLTVILGKGTEYDYRLLDDPEFREKEIQKFLELTKNS
jgi:hypothetical protein